MLRAIRQDLHLESFPLAFAELLKNSDRGFRSPHEGDVQIWKLISSIFHIQI